MSEEAEKEERVRVCGGGAGWAEILDRPVREGLNRNVTFQLRPLSEG